MAESALQVRPLLNQQRPRRGDLKILILSAPKTGNTWLRWLLHHAYGLPIGSLPTDWSAVDTTTLPRAFVSHQHLAPHPDLLRWLVNERVVVLTTVRHPGDTFMSLFHYVKWSHDPRDQLVTALRSEGRRPGPVSESFLRVPFPQIYGLSLLWHQLGAWAVRYEDMLADPVRELTRITSLIHPVRQDRIEAATLLCKPEQMRRGGNIDTRHIRLAGADDWKHSLRRKHIEILSTTEPYLSACRQFDYGWDRKRSPRQTFDYDSIDPFRGATQFDNGEVVSPSLMAIYLTLAPDARRRWPDPRITAGNSFWRWLQQPCEAAERSVRWPAATLTNAMDCTYRMRTDLHGVYPDPGEADRSAFVHWFLGQAHRELRLPWGLIAPVHAAYGALIAEQLTSERGPVA